jgi:hypothetical protein
MMREKLELKKSIWSSFLFNGKKTMNNEIKVFLICSLNLWNFIMELLISPNLLDSLQLHP